MLLLLALACHDSGLTTFNAAPQATIVSHDDGDTVDEATDVELRGVLSDPDHDTTTLRGTWRVEGDKACEDLVPDDDGIVDCETAIYPGQVEIVLEARDPGGAADSDIIALTVLPTAAPEARILSPYDDGLYYSDAKITFAATVDDGEDQPGDLVAWWESDLDGVLDVDAEPNSEGDLEGFSYLSEGEHAITLTVEDSSGKSGSDSVIIDVGPPNTRPECGITAPADGSASELGGIVRFEGFATDVDVGADQLEVTWTSDKDGALGTSTPDSSTGQVVLPIGTLSVNSHVITLTVIDEVGASCTDFIVYAVGTAPTIEVTSPESGSVANEGDTLRFSATVDDSEDSPSDLRLSWVSDIDGEFSSRGPDSTGVATFTTASLSAGEHTLTASVTDPDGLFAEYVLTFTINALPSAPEVSLGPDPATTADALTVSVDVDSEDPEGEAVTYGFQWLVDGVPSTASTTSVLPASATAKGQVWTVVVTPSDDFGEGESAEAEAEIHNTPPELSTVSLGPDPATVDDVLSCSPGTPRDDDSDDVDLAYSWEVSGTTLALTSSTLSATYFERDDTVTCTVTPSDDEESGSSVPSNTVTIENSVPSIVSVSITPDPATADDALVCSWSGFDDDDADEDASTVAWTIDGAAAGTTTTLAGGFGGGDSVTCTVTPRDGIDRGTALSATVVIDNTPPRLEGVTLSPADAAEGDTLTCTPGSSTDVDGDTVTYSYRWNVSGSDPGRTSSSLSSLWFDRDDEVFCTVTPSDGTDAGSSVDSNLVTISNTAPRVSLVSLTPSSPDTDDTLTASVASTDADGDAVTLSYAWTINGTEVAASGNALSGSTWFSKGDVVSVSVTPDDGTDEGTPVASGTVTVVNTPPTAPVVSISPSNPEEGVDELLCEIVTDGTDADGDPVSYSFAWDFDGSAFLDPETTIEPDDTVPATEPIGGEVWTCTVTPDDGEDSGSDGTDSVTIQAPAGTDYTGTYTLDFNPYYRCAYGMVNISFSRVNFVDSYPNMTVGPTGGGSQPGTMYGTFSSSVDWAADNVLSGLCTETYEMWGSFTDENTFEGGFSASFTGSWCYDCSYQEWTLTGTR